MLSDQVVYTLGPGKTWGIFFGKLLSIFQLVKDFCIGLLLLPLKERWVKIPRATPPGLYLPESIPDCDFIVITLTKISAFQLCARIGWLSCEYPLWLKFSGYQSQI